jgi:8-hydroxy-5-deazaflavin:NADPH oxidoreductase
MNIGMIGAGMVALAVAREALAKGHQVVLSSRSGPAALAGKVAELGPGALAATVQEAAALDYVLLAVPWAAVEAALSGLPAWNGRVLIDATNPFVETSPKLVLADLGGVGASEIVASALSQTDVTGRRSSLARMAAADWVQTKGLGLALCSAR